jgi:hypothetical protein
MIYHHILLLSGSVYHRPYTLGGVLELFTLFTVCSTRAEVAWVVVVWVVIGCMDKVRFEAPAVWEHGGWAVQGLQPSRTQGRQICCTNSMCCDATPHKTRIKTFNSHTTIT